MLQKVGSFNDLSQELIDSVPKLEGVQWFQMLNGVSEIDMDTKEKVLRFGKTQLPTKDTIRDPFNKNKVVNIGVIKEVEKGEVVSFKHYVAGQGQSLFSGRFCLDSNSLDDVEFYYMFMLGNANGKNPNRDTTKPILFEPLYFEELSKEKSKTRSTRLRALNIVDGFTPTEKRDFASALNWGVEANLDILTEKIEEFADNNPDAFLKIWGDSSLKIKSLVGRAFKYQVLSHDKSNNTVSWVTLNQPIASFDKNSKEPIVNLFTNWLETHADGTKVKNSLTKQVNELVKKELEKQSVSE